MQAIEKGLSPIQVREASFKDHLEISALESRSALDTKSYEEWSYLWSGNPVYKVHEKDWPIGWVLENEEKIIVGYLGNIPMLYEMERQRIVAAGTHGWAVDPAYRSYAILLLDRYFRQKTADLYLSTTVNQHAFKAFTSFNSLPVPVGMWDRSAFWITDYRGFASSLLAKNELPFAKVLRYPLSVGLFFKTLFAKPVRRLSRSETTSVEVRLSDGFDNRFNVFWEKLREKNPHLLLAIRTREVLEWHFKYALQKNQLWILTVDNASGLAAYAIFCRQDNDKFGLQRMRLIDFQSLGEDSLFVPIILAALKKCRQGNIHMLEFVGLCPQQADEIKCLSPLKRKLPCWMYFYKAANESLSQSLANSSAWNPSCFDGDSSL